MYILANNGRTIIGQAKTIKGAERVIRRLIDIHPAMTLHVWERQAWLVELNGGLPGFMYSIAYHY